MNGRVDESKNGLLIVEVEDSLNSKSIITSGLYNISVSTYPSQDVMSSKTIQDYSDNNKWDITNFYIYGNKGRIKSLNVSIRIDRDIGSILITSNSDFVSGNYSEFTLMGTCKKTDTTQKKF